MRFPMPMHTHPTTLLALAMLTTPFLQAQEASKPKDAPSEETITLSTFTVSTNQDKGYRAGNSVSATRIDTAIKDLPFTVSAYTEQFITDIGARELPDIVSFAPGVTSGAKEFTQGNTRFSIRGFDGDVQPQRNGFTGNRYVDTANISRVEVVKGPSSLLYGQITPGGTVNYITKRPTNRPFTQLRLQAGSDSFLRSEIDVNRPLNSTLGMRLVGAWENGLEWAQSGKSKSWLVAPSLSFRLSPSSSLVLDFEWAHRNERPFLGMMPNIQIAGLSGAPSATSFPNASARSRQQALVDVGALNLGFLAAPPLDRGFNYANDGDYRESDFESLNLEYNTRLGAHWEGRANYNYNRYRINNKVTGLAQFDVTPAAAYRSATKSLFDYLAEYTADPAGVLADTARTSSVTMTRRRRLQESWAQGNAYQAELAGRYEWRALTLRPLAGAYFLATGGAGRTATSATNQATWNYLNPTTWDRSTDYDPRSFAVDNGYNFTAAKDSAYYGLLTASLWKDRLSAVAGARYNTTSSKTYNMNKAGELGSTYDTSKTTPQAGLGYHPVKDVLLYASYSESFLVEARSLNRPNPAYNPAQKYDAVANPTAITVPAVPTTGKGYEAGIKTDFLDGRISSTVSAFHLERSNRVLSVRQRVDGLSATGTQSFREETFTSQATVDQSEGVELELTWSPLDNWQVYATATAMDIRTTNFTPPPKRSSSDPAVAGDYAAYLAGYDEAVRLISGAVPEGSAETLGSLWTRYTVNQGPAKGLWLAGGGVYTGRKAQRTANPNLFFDAYTLLDAALGYDFRSHGAEWSVTLNAKNLTDKLYYPANQARGLPRRFILSLSTKF